MVFEQQPEHPSQWATIRSVSSKFGMSAETLRAWVRREEVDAGRRPGITSEERERLKLPERENKELRRSCSARNLFQRLMEPLDPSPGLRVIWPG